MPIQLTARQLALMKKSMMNGCALDAKCPHCDVTFIKKFAAQVFCSSFNACADSRRSTVSDYANKILDRKYGQRD